MTEWLGDSGITTAWLTGVILLVGWFVRIAVEKRVEKAVEKKFRDWEVRFSLLHERRVRVMEGLLDQLVGLRQALERSINTNENFPDAEDALAKAEHFIAARKYYFARELGNQLLEVVRKARGALGPVKRFARDVDRDEGASDKVIERYVQALEQVAEDLPRLMEEVEEEFRLIAQGGTDD